MSGSGPAASSSSPKGDWTPSARQVERLAYRRAQARRSVLIAAVSTVVILGGAGLGLVSSPGWPRTRETFFDWPTAKDAFPAVLNGFRINVLVFVCSAAAMLVFGLLLALARTLRGPVSTPLRIAATVYVDVFRGLPLLLVLLLVGFGVPGLRLQGVPTNGIVLGAIALSLTYTAYCSEVFRAGIESVHPSQRAAARSLGLSSAQTTRYVVLPQAVRNVIPPLLNDVVSLTKDSGLITIIGAGIDSIRAAQIETANSYNFTPYVVAGALFLVVTIPMTRLTDAYSRRHGFVPMGGHL